MDALEDWDIDDGWEVFDGAYFSSKGFKKLIKVGSRYIGMATIATGLALDHCIGADTEPFVKCGLGYLVVSELASFLPGR